MGSVKTNLLGSRRAAGVPLALGVLLLVAGVFSSNATAAKVVPVQEQGNPACRDYGLLELTKFENPSVGMSMQNGVTIVVDVTQTTFDWMSTTGIDKVIVKGGPSANVYSYDEEDDDTGLITPDNPGGNRARISHVSFCYDAGGTQASPSPTPQPTVSPTPSPVASPSPTPTPSPTQPPSVTTSPSPTSSPGAPTEGQIPRTGPITSTAYLLVLGLGLILLGFVLAFGPWSERNRSEG